MKSAEPVNRHILVKFLFDARKSDLFTENSDNFDCATQDSIPFLDTSLRIEKGQIVSDLYKKPTDRNQYLLTNRTHPLMVSQIYPFSLALIIKRVSMKPDDQETRFSKL